MCEIIVFTVTDKMVNKTWPLKHNSGWLINQLRNLFFLVSPSQLFSRLKLRSPRMRKSAGPIEYISKILCLMLLLKLSTFPWGIWTADVCGPVVSTWIRGMRSTHSIHWCVGNFNYPLLVSVFPVVKSTHCVLGNIKYFISYWWIPPRSGQPPPLPI